MYLRSWLEAKTAALRRLRRDLEEGRVDEDVVGLLEAINAHPDYFTTSSCSGRIQLAEARILNVRAGFRSVAKWHLPPEPGEKFPALPGAPPFGSEPLPEALGELLGVQLIPLFYIRNKRLEIVTASEPYQPHLGDHVIALTAPDVPLGEGVSKMS